jgi:murein DD-endopeptidase MepM/ murein hydrolase activator NlpD
MLSRGRSIANPRAVTALLVAVFATLLALHVFFTVDSQPLGDPLDAMPAGKAAAEEPSEQPESAEPAPPSITISTILDRSTYLDSYLIATGIDRYEAREWSALFQRTAQTRVIRYGHPLTIYRDPENGEMRGLRYDLDNANTVVEASLGSGIIKAAREPIEYFIRPVTLSFSVTDSFRRTAAEKGIPDPIVESLENAFSDRHDLDRLAPGSGVKLIYQEKVSRDGSYTLVGDLQAAQIKFGSRTLEAFSFADEHGRVHLYDEQGRALGPQSLRYPVNFKYISSGFTFHRFHPILGEYRPHVGVDLVAAYGTPVKAVADGRVASSGWMGELGQCVKIEHPRGTTSIYGHLSRISPEARAGSYVRVGQVIGYVGSTGLSTGPHLHFAIERQGKYVNPLAMKLGENHPVPPRMQGLFERIKADYEAALEKLPDLGNRFASSDDDSAAAAPDGAVPATFERPARTTGHVTVGRRRHTHHSRRSAVHAVATVPDDAAGGGL